MARFFIITWDEPLLPNEDTQGWFSDNAVFEKIGDFKQDMCGCVITIYKDLFNINYIDELVEVDWPVEQVYIYKKIEIIT